MGSLVGLIYVIRRSVFREVSSFSINFRHYSGPVRSRSFPYTYDREKEVINKNSASGKAHVSVIVQ